MSVLLMTIATGDVYRKYAVEMLASAHEFWPEASTLVFTDFPQQMQAYSRTVHTNPKGHPHETLFRYDTFLKAQHVLEQWDHVFFCDADMLFVSPVGDVLSDGLVATLHPGFVGTRGTPELREESKAFCNTNTAYYAGGFQGGNTKQYIKAMKVMSEWVQADIEKGIIATWWDESHWNKYLATEEKPAKVLTPSYCYPEDYSGYFGWQSSEYPPVLVALEKRKRGNHPRPE